MFKMNLQRLRKLLEDNGVDAAIVLSPEYLPYSTGSVNAITKMVRDRLSLAIFPKVGEPVFLVCNIEENQSKNDSWIKDVRSYIEFKESPIKALVDVLADKGLLGKRIGIEMGFLCAADYLMLGKLAPNTSFVDVTKIFNRMCMIKEKEEVEILQHAAICTRKAIEAAYLLAQPGYTEKQIADFVENQVLYAGADEIVWIAMGTGRNALFFHAWPSSVRLEKGDITRMDCGGRWRGYFSDVARIAVVGRPSDKQKKIYDVVLKVQRAVIEKMQVGTRACDLYFKCKDTYEKSGLPFILPHIGHGLGTELHGLPILSPVDETPLEENMVINVEPIYVEPGEAVYHLEDLVLITSSGPKILTGAMSSNELFVID